jgi:hypothetical protein
MSQLPDCLLTWQERFFKCVIRKGFASISPGAIRMQRRRRGESESREKEGLRGRVSITGSNIQAKFPGGIHMGKP